MNAFITFNKGLLQSRPATKAWLLLIVMLNMIAPLIITQHRIAMVVLITMMLNMALMTILTARFGFSRILGLGHILWIPLSLYLFTFWPEYPLNSPLGL